MVVWQRHLHTVLRHIARRTEHHANAHFISSSSYPSTRVFSSIASGEVVSNTQTLWRIQSASVARPFYQYLQRSWISSSRKVLADSTDAAPSSSPLTPLLPSSTTGPSESQKAISKPSKVQAILKGIKQSPKKINLVAALVRGMRVEDALLQLQVTIKRAAKTVYQVIHSARANATHNYGLDPDKLLVAEAFVGKGLYKKRIRYHGKGKCGLKIRPECRLTIVLREITAEEEAEIAKLKVSNFRKLSKRERRLVPHRLIETTPIWNRKGKGSSRDTNAMAA